MEFSKDQRYCEAKINKGHEMARQKQCFAPYGLRLYTNNAN
jgi:hypothetical protein